MTYIELAQGCRDKAELARLKKGLVVRSTEVLQLTGVETRVLVQAVKRNLSRFPEDFMFQLAAEEWQVLRSQSVISNAQQGTDGRGGRRTAP